MSAESEPLVFLRGRMIPSSEAHIAFYDSAVVLGATLTDMARTIGHLPFRLEDHVARFFRSCKYARIQPPLSEDELVARARELVEQNLRLVGKEDDLSIVMFMSPGEIGVYAGAADIERPMEPTLCVHTFPLPFRKWAPYFKEGAHVVTPWQRHVPPQCVDPKIKYRSRLHWWLADQETRLVDPQAVTLLLDLDGNVTECTGANFLIVRDGTLVCPSPRNILRGISMVTAVELCGELGIPVEERDFQVYDVVQADEAMLASTPYCLAPVTKINEHTIGSGASGPVFHRLLTAWSERVGKDLLAQVTGG
jgi:branched-chain amino acid aminotransferase